jgi:hypothetical protein
MESSELGLKPLNVGAKVNLPSFELIEVFCHSNKKLTNTTDYIKTQHYVTLLALEINISTNSKHLYDFYCVLVFNSFQMLTVQFCFYLRMNVDIYVFI